MILFTPFKSMLINVFFFPSSFSSFCVCVCVLKSMFLQVGKVCFQDNGHHCLEACFKHIESTSSPTWG